MATVVEVPKLGNTVEECIVATWRKRKGDVVAAGEVVAEIETDKATFELPAPVAGTLLETFFEEGALVPVFTNLFVIGEPGESVESFRPQSSGPPVAAPVARTPEPGAVPVAAQTPRSANYSPRARRFADEHHFHPGALAGSGPNGRVLEEDVRRAWHDLGGAGRQPAADFPPAKAGKSVSTIRERIAHRMRESLATTAQYTLNASADATALLAVRAKLKAANSSININDLITFCTIKALLDAPDLNAEYIDGRIHRHSEVNVGFAVDTPRGLIVPVIRNAHELNLEELSRQARSLTAAAQQGSISPDHLSGATFTISNLGALGIENFTPLLNPPQVAILGVGAITVKPVRRDSQIAFTDTIGLSLTCDHQAIDGAPGARFLQVLRQKIESVEALCTI
ncbi:MAG TPA: dihydrolipoamide acetyltransferase family protein [Bryobacteraceae bacterium]|nr:dihydrolipoamide acetyltransferase family protein [Bryobacteraceae bacterium]